MSGASPSSDIPPKIQTPAIMANFESMLSALEKSFMPACEVCAIIIFILQGRKLRSRGVTPLFQGWTAGKWLSQVWKSV